MSSAILPLFALFFILTALAALIWFLYAVNQKLEAKNTAISDRCARLEASLKDAETSLSDAMRQSEFCGLASEHAPDGIVVQDMSGRILWSNPAFTAIHGRSASDVLGKHPVEFALPSGGTLTAEDIAAFAYVQNDPRFGAYQVVENRRANGDLFWNQISVSLCQSVDGRDIAVQICRDVTQQVEQADALRNVSQQLKYDAQHDELTGAANRGAFHEYFEDVVADPDKAPVGILHIDLDNFKDINDGHGHSTGDAVLVHVTRVLQASVRPGDMVSRIGGDEFVVTCPRTSDLAQLNDIAANLVEKLAQPFTWGKSLITCEASIGAALSGEDPVAEDLLARADFALYQAKRAGRNQTAIYDTPMQQRHEIKVRRSSEFADALKTDALDCFFQPKMALDTGKIVGVEALVRWNHPKDGLIPPGDFLPIAKDRGLMAELDLQSMSFAIREKQKLTEAGFGDIGVAFNASPELLVHSEFVDRLIWEADTADVDRQHITIEVLETTDFGNRAETSSQASAVHRLYDAGFQVHLDDFGVGFAGLSHLATLNVTGVKLDRSLVSELSTEVTSQKIVRKIIELANDLSLSVIAEGVEQSETAVLLQNMGCNVIQGYWLAKPMPSSALQSWLEVRRRQSYRKLA